MVHAAGPCQRHGCGIGTRRNAAEHPVHVTACPVTQLTYAGCAITADCIERATETCNVMLYLHEYKFTTCIARWKHTPLNAAAFARPPQMTVFPMLVFGDQTTKAGCSSDNPALLETARASRDHARAPVSAPRLTICAMASSRM
jgi:hypothetical protein